MTPEEKYLPKPLWKFVDKPYGGLFGDAVITHVVQELVADPDAKIMPTELADLLGKSYNPVNNSLKTLAALDFLIKDERDPQRPVYVVNQSSQRLIALTFLALGDIDDREGTKIMDRTILEYCRSLNCDMMPQCVTVGATYESGSSSVGDIFHLGQPEAEYIDTKQAGDIA
jgi:hypothetical protein